MSPPSKPSCAPCTKPATWAISILHRQCGIQRRSAYMPAIPSAKHSIACAKAGFRRVIRLFSRRARPRVTHMDRYHRQSIFLGTEANDILANSRVLVIGCGALGSVICEQLTRAGVGMLRIVDRDIV